MGETRELGTLKWFPTLKGIKSPPPAGKIRVDFEGLQGKLFQWVGGVLQPGDF